MRVFTSFYHPIVIAWVSKSRAGSGRELDDAMGIQSGSGNLGVVPGLPDGRLPGPALGLEDAALRLGRLRSRPGRPRHAGPCAGSLSERGAAVPQAGGLGPFAPGHQAVRAGLLLRRGRLVGRRLLRALPPQPQVRHPHGANRALPGPVDRAGDGHRATATASGAGGSAASPSSWPAWAAPRGRLFCSASPRPRPGRRRLSWPSAASSCMTYPSLHTFVGSTVPASGQTMAFSWVSNIQLLSGARRLARLRRPFGRPRHPVPVHPDGRPDAGRLPVLRPARSGILRGGRGRAAEAPVTHEGTI